MHYIEEHNPHYVSKVGYRRMMAWYDAALSQIDHEAIITPTRFGDTHILAAGEGVPVFLLHGININASVWSAQIAGLEPFCRVYAPDIPGFAGKSAPTRIPYAGRGYADWLVDVLDNLSIDRALVVGSSAGGYFALKMAAFQQERVSGLLLLNPLGLAPFRSSYYNLLCNPRMARLAQQMARCVVRSPEIARRLVERGMYGRATDENIDLAMILLHDYNRAHAPKPMPLNELQHVNAPVHLMVSEYELYTNPAQVETVAQAALPNLIAVEHVAEAGHDINKERPDAVNGRILDLIEAIVLTPL